MSYRLETSTTQVNAALHYLLDKGAKINGPIREINHYGFRSNLPPDFRLIDGAMRRGMHG
jgi:hypothetical protein